MKTENKENEALNKTDVNHCGLSLENITAYLPYKLNLFIDGIVCELEGIDLHKEKTLIAERVNYNFTETKLILRPITDIFNKITINNETFRFSVKMDLHLYFNSSEDLYLDIQKGYIANNFYKKLLEYHFDVFGLIEKGLAVSIHDFEQHCG